jgi:hypothetical protein
VHGPGRAYGASGTLRRSTPRRDRSSVAVPGDVSAPVKRNGRGSTVRLTIEAVRAFTGSESESEGKEDSLDFGR